MCAFSVNAVGVCVCVNGVAYFRLDTFSSNWGLRTQTTRRQYKHIFSHTFCITNRGGGLLILSSTSNSPCKISGTYFDPIPCMLENNIDLGNC